MKRIKPGLIALAAMTALILIGPGSASATRLYSGATGLNAGTVLKGTLVGTTSFTTTSGTVLDTCTGGGVTGQTSNTGSAGVEVNGSIATSGLTFSGCTKTTDVSEGCFFAWQWISGTLNATVWWKGCKITISVSAEFGGTCTYTFGSGWTHLGTFKGVTVAWEIAKLLASAVISGAAGNSFLCPSDVKWVGDYSFTSPSPLHATNS